jgi:hypothetical protein
MGGSGRSNLPPPQGQKPNRDDKPKRQGPRQGSLGRKGGGRPLADNPDETVTARPVRCAQCQGALRDADQTLAGRYDKVDLPKVAPVVSRVERHAGLSYGDLAATLGDSVGLWVGLERLRCRECGKEPSSALARFANASLIAVSSAIRALAFTTAHPSPRQARAISAAAGRCRPR